MSGSERYETVDAYIAAQPEEVRPLLEKIRAVIRKAAPDAVEKISYEMPTYWQGENLIHFAAFKDHLSIFAGGQASTTFADKLTDYQTSKGTIQIQMDQEIPYDLIAEITRWRVKQVEAKHKK